MTLNPQATTRVGDRIIKSNFKFWIIYLKIVAERLNDFAKTTLRTRLFGDSESQQAGLFPFSKTSEREILLKEIGSLINAEKLEVAKEEQKEDD